MRIFEKMESEVRGYIRSFPTVFDTAIGSEMFDERGNRYIDFFAGAGTLNYGHNNPAINQALIGYLQNDGIIHGLDQATVAKKSLLQKLADTILAPVTLLVVIVSLSFALSDSHSVLNLVLIAWGLLASAFAPLLLVYAFDGRPDEKLAISMLLAGTTTYFIGKIMGWTLESAVKEQGDAC
jgi:hypothetical protein